MKFIFTVLVAIAAIALFLVITPTITGNAIGASECKDSDGYDPFTAGAIQYKIWFIIPKTVADRCDNGKVVEAYCVGTNPRFSVPSIPCKEGCETVDIKEFSSNLKAARCKKTDIPCRDSDEGINEKKFGFTISNSGVNFDNCKDALTLNEFYCNGEIASLSEVACDSAKGYDGCSGGICKEGAKNETPVKNETERNITIVLIEGETIKKGDLSIINDADDRRILKFEGVFFPGHCSSDVAKFTNIITGKVYEAVIGCANETITPMTIGSGQYHVKSFRKENTESNTGTVQLTWGVGSSPGNEGSESSYVKALHYIENEKAKIGEWIYLNNSRQNKILEATSMPSSMTCDSTDKVVFKGSSFIADVTTPEEYEAVIGCANETITPLFITSTEYHIKVNRGDIHNNSTTVQVTWGTGSSPGNPGAETKNSLDKWIL